MKNQKLLYLILVLFTFSIYSCTRKTYPDKTTETAAKNATPISAKDYKKEQAEKGSTDLPKVIVVSDAAAKKTANGKYYYELNGYRYWKNTKDGKYYLNGIFNQKSKKN